MQLFIDSIAIYLAAWIGALRRRGRALAPLKPARLLVLAVFPAFLALQLFHGACLLLDHLLFPGFRRIELRRPVFVLGVPRSGTTFLHRKLAQDPAFTAPRTWEVLLAPALCQRYLLTALARIDGLLERPCGRLLDWVVKRTAGGLASIHSIGLTAAEEDYLALLPAGGCFFVHMLFPQASAFLDLASLDRLPPARRRRLLDHYHGLMQRQVYFHGGKQLLSKNAAFAGWTRALRERYPDACLVLCIREPGAALISQLTSLAGARKIFAAYPRDADLQHTFLRLFEDWWNTLDSCARSLSPAPLVVEQEWLRGHTGAVLSLVYQQLERDPPPGLAGLPMPVSPPRSSRWDLDAEALGALQQPYRRLRSLAEVQRSPPS